MYTLQKHALNGILIRRGERRGEIISNGEECVCVRNKCARGIKIGQRRMDKRDREGRRGERSCFDPKGSEVGSAR